MGFSHLNIVRSATMLNKNKPLRVQCDIFATFAIRATQWFRRSGRRRVSVPLPAHLGFLHLAAPNLPKRQLAVRC